MLHYTIFKNISEKNGNTSSNTIDTPGAEQKCNKAL